MILGLTGAKRSGKNTVAQFIAEEYGDEYDVKEWSFAYKLKKSAAEALGITEDHIEFCNKLKEDYKIFVGLSEDLPLFKITGRKYLQYYGTEAHRDIFGDDFWVKQTIDEISNVYEDGNLPALNIITDLRFENEAAAVKIGTYEEPNGKVIRILRPEVEDSTDIHVSEKPLSNKLIDYEILNSGSLDDLRESVKRALENDLRYNYNANKI